MNQDQGSLDNLVDIVVPDPVSWWPPAIGWWLVLALILIWLSAYLISRTSRWIRNRYRREAIRLLDQLQFDRANPAKQLGEMNRILKRVALVSFPRDTVASLTGPAWLEFLQKTSSEQGFQNQPASHLADISSNVDTIELSEHELSEITRSAKSWIRRHSGRALTC